MIIAKVSKIDFYPIRDDVNNHDHIGIALANDINLDNIDPVCCKNIEKAIRILRKDVQWWVDFEIGNIPQYSFAEFNFTVNWTIIRKNRFSMSSLLGLEQHIPVDGDIET